MKHIKAINEAVGTIIERRASAESLLKAVVNGDTTEVEGIALSKQMAQGFLDWLQFSTYGKKFGALPFYKLFSASFNWGLDRFVKGANTEVKGEFKELKAKAKSMKEAKELNESSAEDVLKDATNALTKTLSSKKLDKSYVKDYLKSIETMARKKPGDFVKDYSNFSNADWIEDVEYNFANENKVTEAVSRSDKAIKDLEKQGSEINYLDDADAATKKIWKKAGVNVDDENTIILYSYVANPWDDVKNIMKKNNIDFKELKDPNADGESMIVFVKESITEARFVKDFDEAVLNATTKKEVEKIYPKAKFFVGKLTHFFGELDNNLFFRAHYAGKKDGSFKIKSVYSKKGSNYVHLFNELGESVVNESSGSEERRIALRAMKSIAKYLNRDLRTSAQYLINAAEDVQRDIEKGKVK